MKAKEEGKTNFLPIFQFFFAVLWRWGYMFFPWNEWTWSQYQQYKAPTNILDDIFIVFTHVILVIASQLNHLIWMTLNSGTVAMATNSLNYEIQISVKEEKMLESSFSVHVLSYFRKIRIIFKYIKSNYELFQLFNTVLNQFIWHYGMLALIFGDWISSTFCLWRFFLLGISPH